MKRQVTAFALAWFALSSPAALADDIWSATAQNLPSPDTHAPAGVMFDHMHKAGEFMIGYTYNWAGWGGDTLHGTSAVDDETLMRNACQSNNGGQHCMMKQTGMTMQMHMLDIMYAPTDWLTVMAMPQWMSMDMSMGMLPMMMPMMMEPMESMETSGFGDTLFGALVRLAQGPGYHVHAGLVFSAPTGSVSERGASGLLYPYGMQLGSGTWDFRPSLTYTGRQDRWAWGAQLNGIIRMESENDEGYRLGNQFQATAWGSYRLIDWLSASARMLYTNQGQVASNGSVGMGDMPGDFPHNYGGQFLDVGLGVNAILPEGLGRLGVEWVQPIVDDVNGYQQGRDGTLWVKWSKSFGAECCSAPLK
jgi:hypothetical protein